METEIDINYFKYYFYSLIKKTLLISFFIVVKKINHLLHKEKVKNTRKLKCFYLLAKVGKKKAN